MIRNEIENVFFKFRLFNKINSEFKNRFMNFNYTKETVYDEKSAIKNYKAFVKSVARG